MNKIPYIGFGDTAYIDQSTAERIPTHEFMIEEVNHMRSICIAYQEEIKLYKEALELQRNIINTSEQYIESLDKKYEFAIKWLFISHSLLLLSVLHGLGII